MRPWQLRSADGRVDLAFTPEGMHVEPDRDDIIDALLGIATDMLPFLTQSEGQPPGKTD